MSPSLLSRRLTELEAAGIVRQVVEDERGTPEYQLTEPGRDLRPVIESIGIWGQRWVDADLSLDNLDPSLLMWDMRRNLDASPLPDERSVIQFIYSDLPLSQKNWWLIVEPDGMVDLCSVDPGFEIDLYVTTDLRPMTAIWMGLSTVKAERKNGALDLIGDQELSRHMQTWLGLSPFAVEPKRV